MHDDDKRPDPRKATGEPFGHLTQRDTRTPEEKAAGGWNRIPPWWKGRGRKDWWKDAK